jgi:hypothetical protein
MAIVSTIWCSNVASYRLFSTILKSIKTVVSDEHSSVKKQAKGEEVKKFKIKRVVDQTKEYTSTRMLPANVLKKNFIPRIESAATTDKKSSSKFSKRFNMLDSSSANLERAITPSTTTSEIESDEN